MAWQTIPYFGLGQILRMCWCGRDADNGHSHELRPEPECQHPHGGRWTYAGLVCKTCCRILCNLGEQP